MNLVLTPIFVPLSGINASNNMVAPKGNRFWEVRSKHGRDKIFKSPDKMWAAACEYFKWCEDNPYKEDNIEILKVNGFGDEAKRMPFDKMRPFTMQGLCRHLNCNTKYFNDFEYSLNSGNFKGDKEGFSEIVTRIREIVYENKFSGAASGFFNPNIIARDLGLIDKTEVTKQKFVVKRTQ